jgi:phosphate transport system substrate-binding protein
MMKRLLILGAAALLAGCDGGDQREGDRTRGVWAVGSSTVAPFSSRVAEEFARKTGGAAPRVESLGTGGGIKLFCSGVGAGTPDVANASRRIKASEFEQCRANGVTEIVELEIGYDGVVLAGARNGADYAMSLTDLYRGVGAQIPGPGDRIVNNPHRTWNQIRAGLPPVRIQVYGPPPTSGTRDAFVELGLHAGAEELPALARIKEADKDRFEEIAGRVREDGAWVDSGENDNAIIQTLTRTPGALGVFGYSFLGQNRDRVKAAAIDGVAPTDATIQDGSYALARPLYVYVKKAHVDRVPGLRDYLREFVSEAAVGRGGYLGDIGLIPLPGEELVDSRRRVAELRAMQAPPK